MGHELREFTYLDTMSVNSLLASQYMTIPETIRDVSEDVYEEMDESGWGFTLGYEGIASASAGSGGTETEESRRLAETERRVNDQYRFSILHRSLTRQKQLIDLNQVGDEGGIKFDSGDVIKASGICTTDPLYRLFRSMSDLMRIGNLEQVEKTSENEFEEITDSQGNLIFDNWREVLHGERISLKMELDNFRYPVLMSVVVDDLWTTTPEREFIGAHDHTVVGRVSHVTTGQTNWDFIELLRIMGSIFSESSVNELRDVLMGLIEELENENESGIKFDVQADSDDLVVGEPAVVINPIAIYW